MKQHERTFDKSKRIEKNGQEAPELKEAGNTVKALEKLKEQEQLARELGDGPLAQNLGDQIFKLMSLRRFDEAMPLLEELTDICRRRGDSKALATCFVNMAGIHYEKSRDIGHIQGLIKAHDHAVEAYKLANKAYNIAVENGIIEMVGHLNSFQMMLKGRIRPDSDI